MSRKKSYGYMWGGTSGRQYPVAASLKVHPQGGFWVLLDSAGRVTLALDGSSTLLGWAMFPVSLKPGGTDATNGYWTSSSTQGLDKVYVITDPTAVFSMPVVSGDVWAQARAGETADIVGVSSADGTPQEANLSATSTVVLRVEAGDDDNTGIIYVRMNPGKLQVDSAGG